MQQKPVIFLAFANDEAQYLRYLATEAQKLRRALFMAKQYNLCQVEERFGVSIRDIFQVGKGIDISIFHYAGHADDNTMSLSQAGSENIWIDTTYLNDFLARQESLHLVFLNACSSKAQAEDLLSKGVPVVIGTSTQIKDSTATELAAHFYESMIAGKSIGEAWKDATDEILANTTNEKDIWKKVESSTESESRGLVDKKGKKLSVPWKMYFKDEKVLEWKLEKFGKESFNLELGTENKNDKNSNQSMVDFEQIHKWIDTEEYSKVFNELDKYYENISDKTTYNRLKKEHTRNMKSLDYDDRMRTFVDGLKEKK